MFGLSTEEKNKKHLQTIQKGLEDIISAKSLNEVKDNAAEMIDFISDYTSKAVYEAKKYTTETIKERPLSSMGAGVLLGAILGGVIIALLKK